jgi:hypothetical protein
VGGSAVSVGGSAVAVGGTGVAAGAQPQTLANVMTRMATSLKMLRFMIEHPMMVCRLA